MRHPTCAPYSACAPCFQFSSGLVPVYFLTTCAPYFTCAPCFQFSSGLVPVYFLMTSGSQISSVCALDAVSCVPVP